MLRRLLPLTILLSLVPFVHLSALPFFSTLGLTSVGGSASVRAADERWTGPPLTAPEDMTVTQVCGQFSDVQSVTLGIWNSSAGAPATARANSAGGTASASPTATCQAVTNSITSGTIIHAGVEFEGDSGQGIYHDGDGEAGAANSFLETGVTYSAGTISNFGTASAAGTNRYYRFWIVYTPGIGGASFVPAIINAPMRGGGTRTLGAR